MYISAPGLELVQSNSTRFLGLNSNLDPIFGFNRVRGPQDKKRVGSGRFNQKNGHKFKFKPNST